MKTFNTGIMSLDSQLNGGFRAGSVVLVLEDPGAGGEVFTYHFALEGIKRGERVLYVCTEDTSEEIVNGMINLLGVPEEVARKIEFVDIIGQRLRIGCDGSNPKSFIRSMRYDPLNGLKSLVEKEKYDRVIINSLSYFVMNYEERDVIALVETFSLQSKMNESIFFVLLTKGMFNPQFETTMKHFADGVIELTLKEVENEVQRRFKILKLKNAFVPKAVLRYDIAQKGIRMESVMRVL